MIFSIFAVAPIFFFVFAVYPFGDTTNIAMLKADHKLYLYSWYFFVGSHFLLFTPIVTVWGLIDNVDPKPTQAAFYKYWMLEMIMVFAVPMFIITEALFIAAIIVDKDDEDASFSLLSPIIVALFYGFASLFTGLSLYADAKSAVLFYDDDVR